MPEKSVFLRIGDQLINISAVSHVDLHDTKKTADVYVGQAMLLGGSADAYEFFSKDRTGWFFVIPPNAI